MCRHNQHSALANTTNCSSCFIVQPFARSCGVNQLYSPFFGRFCFCPWTTACFHRRRQQNNAGHWTESEQHLHQGRATEVPRQVLFVKRDGPGHPGPGTAWPAERDGHENVQWHRKQKRHCSSLQRNAFDRRSTEGWQASCLFIFWVFEYLEILHGYFFPHDNTCGPLVFGDRPNYFFKWPKKIKSIPVIMSETLDQWILLRRVLIQLWDEWSEFFNEKRLHGHKSHGKHVFLFEPKCHVGEVITRSMLSYRLELQYFWFRSHQFQIHAKWSCLVKRCDYYFKPMFSVAAFVPWLSRNSLLKNIPERQKDPEQLWTYSRFTR